MTALMRLLQKNFGATANNQNLLSDRQTTDPVKITHCSGK